MRNSGTLQRGWLLLIGLVLLFLPAAFLMVTLLILIAGRNIVVNDLTPVRIFELYLVKLALYTVFLFVLYWVVTNIFEYQIPAALDKIERHDKDTETADRRDGESTFDADGRRENENQ